MGEGRVGLVKNVKKRTPERERCLKTVVFLLKR